MIDNKYRFEGRDKNGRKIIIDISREGSAYEVMALYPNGTEIASGIYHTLDEAERAYHNMITLYALRDGENPPLKGKYAKLRDDLKAAREKALQAVEGEDDGGTCNLDAPALYLPRWNTALVEQAAKEAGGSCFIHRMCGGRYVVFSTPNVGQANRNTIAAEAMTAELSARGYDATTYYRID